MKIKFGATRIPTPQTFRKDGPKPGRPFGTPVSQKQLNALWRNSVPPGAALNPYGRFGDTPAVRFKAAYFNGPVKKAFREEGMKRTRVRMKEKRALALEAHELQQIARENAVLCMNTLVEIASNTRAPESTRIAASAVILDRAYGKSSQTSITANVTNDKKSNLDGTELDKRIEQALKRVEGLTNRTAKTGTGKKRPINLREYN